MSLQDWLIHIWILAIFLLCLLYSEVNLLEYTLTHGSTNFYDNCINKMTIEYILDLYYFESIRRLVSVSQFSLR